MTYRERRERKAEKLREWAEKRKAAATASFNAARSAVEGIPLGQPILVGHHSEKRHRRTLEKSDKAMHRGIEHEEKAKEMTSRAGNIEDALDRAIYSDDPDAIERLEDRIADLELRREQIKKFNATCRKGTPDWALISGKDATELKHTWILCPYHKPEKGFPAYVLQNLNSNLTRMRKRLVDIDARKKADEKTEAAGGFRIERFPDCDWCRVRFSDKPDRSILNELKAAGFGWSSGAWSGLAHCLPASVLAMEQPTNPDAVSS